jgi:zinc and cadmium transporter
VLRRVLKPLVALAAGSLLGGALFHMLPHALHAHGGPAHVVLAWVAVGFALFLALDQLLEWHHCHLPPGEHVRPLGPLLLVADAVHNLLGGLAVGAVFVLDLCAGLAAWVAAALHEVPQEIGDFGAIVHAGYPRGRALALNLASALTFPLGGVAAWWLQGAVDVAALVALGAGSSVYIAAADLLPEVKRSEALGETVLRFACFAAGCSLLYAAHAGG